MRCVILDDDGNELRAGEVGHVYYGVRRAGVRVPGRPGATASVHRGKAFTIGDVGYLDDDGYLFLRDRAKDMIISGGVNIYPAEVEGVLAAHPAVGDVAVIGVPDDEWGEPVKAVVELGRPGTRRRRARRRADRVLPGRSCRLQVPAPVEFRAYAAPHRRPASSTSGCSATSTPRRAELRLEEVDTVVAVPPLDGERHLLAPVLLGRFGVTCINEAHQLPVRPDGTQHLLVVGRGGRADVVLRHQRVEEAGERRQRVVARSFDDRFMHGGRGRSECDAVERIRRC